MSDLSTLSHEYASATDYSRQINDAVLLLKKRLLGSVQEIDDDAVRRSHEILHRTVQGLLRRFGHKKITNVDDIEIPEDVLTRIEAKHQGTLGYFQQDLINLDELFKRREPLSNSQISILDSICEAADASASATFRKLWRR